MSRRRTTTAPAPVLGRIAGRTGSVLTVATATAIVLTTAMAIAGCSSSDSDDTRASGTGTSAPTQATPQGPSQAPSQTPVARTSSNVRRLLMQDFATAIKEPGVVILDVRTPTEFAEGHIANAKNIDVEASTFKQQIAALDKSATYAVYCRTGRRSADATRIMVEAGFAGLIDLTGGITTWSAAGNPVTKA